MILGSIPIQLPVYLGPYSLIGRGSMDHTVWQIDLNLGAKIKHYPHIWPGPLHNHTCAGPLSLRHEVRR